MANPADYRPQPGTIPTSPGVYTFRDKEDRVLYVGKAKNLRNRLGNYFQNPEKLHPRTRTMVYTADHVQWTIVETEVEALNLEYSLIQRFDPPYNVLLRDGKSYPMLAVSVKEEVPRAFLYRGERRKGIRYFGPYPKAWAIKETLDMLTRVFPIRTCSKSVYTRHEALGRPCLKGYIDRCSAPCSGKISIEGHRELVDQFTSFMGGNTSEVTKELRGKMLEASEELNFEKAADYRDQLGAVEQVMEKQAIVLPQDTDADLIAMAHNQLEAAIQIFHVRSGRLIGQQGWIMDISEAVDIPESTSTGSIPSNEDSGTGSSSELLLAPFLEDFMTQFYGTNFELSESLIQTGGAASNSKGEAESALESTIPREILIPFNLEGVPALEDWLSEKRGSRVQLRVPQRGEKRSLMDTVHKNAQLALDQHQLKRASDITTRSAALQELQEALEIPESPLRIECTDISHIQGTDVVASLVVFEDGLPKKSDYRKYKVKDAAGDGHSDDVASIAEIVRRRFAHYHADDRYVPVSNDSDEILDGELVDAPDMPLLEQVSQEQISAQAAAQRKTFAYKPQLFIVDGGKPQVNAAAEVLKELGIEDVVLVGMAKRLEEIWVPGEDYPVILSRNSEAMFLLQRIRDEAHRFAIDFHRSQRSKRMKRSVLDNIPGLGPQRKKALVKHFKSVAKLKEASVEDIQEVSGFGEGLAHEVYTTLHKGESRTENTQADTGIQQSVE